MGFDILKSRDDIQSRVKALGAEISEKYRGGDLVLVGVLKGSFIFLADLVRALSIPCEIQFVEAKSYGSGTTSSGEVNLSRDVSSSLNGRDVLLVEDIVDTGHTVQFLNKHFASHHPKSFSVCALLYKPARKVVDVTIDHLGFTIDDHFVIGYGLDLDDKYRELADIAIYDPKKA